MAEDKRKKWNQWAEVLWNIILIVGCMYFFCRLLADMNESGFARMAAEKEAEERRPYLFMDMYRRVVRHRFPV